MVEHTAMNTLLTRLHAESFLLNLQEPLQTLPVIDGYKMFLIDPDTISVEISRDQTINDLFSQLDKHDIHVLSLRNKTSRLEEVFMTMMGNGSQ
jgi:ABC-2 type transport system ATP-binding protein